ncbi:MAG: MmgE/PrpD family protein [Candidatus Cloacimonetes bacterium]|nr:MmgE/PrpD family protein [Candidatus Cloacimonadota bacterium]
MTIITDLVKFIRNSPFEVLPENIFEVNKASMIDCVGVTLSGSKTREADVIERYLKNRPSCEEAVAAGRGWQSDMSGSALINGTMAHAEDFDDCGRGGHITAVLVPAALSPAEYYHRSGKEFMRALILANETQSRIALFAANEMMLSGWHSTSVLGVLGATVAAGILSDLNDEEFISALGLASTRASGLMVHFGTMAKPYHVGMAASAGIECALLAKAGMTASSEAIEGFNGYTQALANKRPGDGDIKFGEPWVIDQCGLYIKRYPTCSASHTAQDALKGIIEENKLLWEDITEITVGVPQYTEHCLIHPDPQDAVQARFSMPFAMAVTAVKGQVRLSSFDENILWDNDVRIMMKKVRTVRAPEFSYAVFIENEPAIVTVETRDGTLYKKRVDYAVGCSLKNPMPREALMEKFIDCAVKCMDEEKVRRLFVTLENITDTNDMAEAAKLLL